MYSGVKNKLVNKNSNGSIVLLVVRILTGLVSFLTSSMLSSTSSTMVTSIGTIEILISKLVPSLSGLIGFVITTGCYFYLETKMWEITCGPSIGFNFNIKKIRWYILEFWERGVISLQLQLVNIFIKSS
jgi:hypothetical protein